MAESILKTKSYEFALRTVRLSQRLAEEKRECVLSKQLLRSGTSIGANVEEANQAESRNDFANKLSIALKKRRKRTTGCVCYATAKCSPSKRRIQ